MSTDKLRGFPIIQSGNPIIQTLNLLTNLLTSSLIQVILSTKQLKFKNILIKICCPILTSYLSGSPIIQNGKLVGAITHVFVNGPYEGIWNFYRKHVGIGEKTK